MAEEKKFKDLELNDKIDTKFQELNDKIDDAVKEIKAIVTTSQQDIRSSERYAPILTSAIVTIVMLLIFQLIKQ